LKPEEVLIVGRTPDSFYMETEIVPLTFGIERYYVPEGEGKPIEDGVRENTVEVVAAVTSAGKAQVRAFASMVPLYTKSRCIK
jgi:GDYXXLXY protein